MTLREILLAKGNEVHTIGPEASLEDVVQKLIRANCGSLVVCDRAGASDDRSPRGRMVGIVTERDILHACAKYSGRPLASLRVSEVMTRDVATGTPGDSVEETMGLMTEHRIRHLPILEGGRLVGLVSIGDVVKLQHQRLSLENHYLKSYIQG
jgi:CBS domain-containing protein